MADNETASNASTSRPGSPAPSLPQSLPQRSAQPAFRFTWDRKKGPGSISNFSEVESKVDYIGNLNAAKGEIQNLNEAALLPDALGAGWSSAKHGFHAISTVLNHPTKRAAPPKAHSTLPTVPPADLPRVRRKDFDPYLKDISPQWDAFQLSLAHITRERSNSASVVDATGTDSIPISPISPSTSIVSTRTTRARPMPSLDTVPAIFFDPDFNLANPETFALVTEISVTNSGPRGPFADQDPASISYSVPLLEKLSHYADTVEGHLVQEIQARSSSFFSALTNLHDLQSESERCLRRIADLKSMLQQIDEKGAKKGLELVREDQKMVQLQRLEDGIKLVKDVQEMRTIAKGLAGAGEWSHALNVVENVRALMDYSPPDAEFSRKTSSQLSTVGEEEPIALSPSPGPPPLDTSKLPAAIRDVSLRSLRAFAALPAELRTLSTQIVSALADEFAAVTRHDLNLRTEGTLDGKNAKVEDEQPLEERLLPLLEGLMRAGENGLKDGLERWREAVLSEVRLSVKRHIDYLTNSVDVDDLDDLRDGARSPFQGKTPPDKPLSERTASLARALSEMAQEEFMNVVRRIYRSLLSCLEGAKAQAAIIYDIVGEQCSKDCPASPIPTTRDPILFNSVSSSALQSTLDSVIFAATELAHKRVSKLILSRSEQHAQLKLFEFYIFYEEGWSFVLSCEVICKKMVVALRGALGGQSTAFLQAFHADKLTRSAKWVEQEEWKAIEVSPRSQRVANLIIASAVNDPSETVFDKPSSGVSGASKKPSDSRSLNSGDLDTEADGTVAPSATGENSAPPAAKSKYLVVEEHSFYIVSATLQVLGLVVDYLKVMINLPNLAFESMNRVVEFLKAFNSRTCQVVLGAGAIRSAGLKNISARHLALASQSLSIMISLVPYIREAYRRHLDPKQFVLLTEFDRLKRDFQEHQNEVHAKLVAIMGEVLNGYIKSLQEVQWEAPRGNQEANQYMLDLVKQTVTLHKVLSKFLGPVVSEPIMSESFAMINHRLGEEYQKIPLSSLEAKERMLTDARYLYEKLSALRGVGSLSNMVVTIVQEKAVMSKSVMNPNGVPNGVSQGSPVPSTSTPRPRGSIDLQAQPAARSNTRQNTLGAFSNNASLAARPSPFAKRTLANLFGGGDGNVTVNASSSTTSLGSASGMSTQGGTSGPGTPQMHASGIAIGSSGGVSSEIMDGRASPVTLPSPPRTPGSVALNPIPSMGFKAMGSVTDDTPQGNVGSEEQGGERTGEPRLAEENNS